MKKLFDAIQIIDDGIITGYITNSEKFVESGFIPKNHVVKIHSGTKKKISRMII